MYVFSTNHKENRPFASIQQRAAHLANCFQTYKKQARTHLSNEDRNLAVSLLSSSWQLLMTAAARRSLKFCLLVRLWVGRHQALQLTAA